MNCAVRVYGERLKCVSDESNFIHNYEITVIAYPFSCEKVWICTQSFKEQ